MAAIAGGSRLVVAPQNLRGFRGLTLDGYGALLEGGPGSMPRVLARLVADRGTVVDRSVHDAWRKALRTQYAAHPFTAFREVHHKVFQELFTRFGIRGEVDPHIDEAFDEYRSVRAYAEVSSVLRDLEADVAMAVISNMDTMVLLQALHQNRLAFTFVITSEEEQRYKPSASIFQRAIRYLGLPAANVLHVGDSYVEDVVGARAVGMGTALIERNGITGNPPRTSGRVIRDLREVKELIRKSRDESGRSG